MPATTTSSSGSRCWRLTGGPPRVKRHRIPRASAPVLHVGDADPAADNFRLLRGLPRVDLALLPFWYVTDDGNSALVARAIRPRRIVLMHVPPVDASQVAADVARVAMPVVVAGIPGSPIEWPR